MTARRCPYFVDVSERQRINPRQSWRLFGGAPASERWRQARAWMRPGMPGATLLLPDADPLAIRWPPGSCLADITDQPGEIVHALAQALIRDGVEHALLIDTRTPTRTVHVKPMPQQVAA